MTGDYYGREITLDVQLNILSSNYKNNMTK